MERTQQESIALFFDILKDIEDGLFVEQACKKHGLPYTTFLHWKKGEVSVVPDAPAYYAYAVECRANMWAKKAIDVAFAQPRMNEFGVDKGDVDLRKVQVETLKWVTAQTSKKWSAKAHEAEEQKPMDIGAITVNLISDTRPKE